MQLNPYLNFNGNCAAAFKFYENSSLAASGDSSCTDPTAATIRTRLFMSKSPSPNDWFMSTFRNRNFVWR
jgi:uncharacterized glyoxalase superfamily protein PhnB